VKIQLFSAYRKCA